ncbi:dihydroneopterin aldolase [Tenuifilum thalassicum]|uniref:7,8-dihydroneopterin aldolase n=1 Tax=Tenuifilum thalassicum TaxID=2590900 RepID=A0A7D3XM65_9BACT|nr:dihydroneopterin aldolase [Tenuifilum thalassicum]QKG80950.1 dihydroneopterin aldolase [Tenuifilum thalassicum]
MALIEIENMEFYAFHGCFKEEQVVGNQFLVNISFETDTSKAQKTDNLNDTVNYQVVYNLVKAEMQKTSKLLEHVAERITSAVKLEFPEIKSIKVKVSKLNPPMGGKIEKVSVTLNRNFAQKG